MLLFGLKDVPFPDKLDPRSMLFNLRTIWENFRKLNASLIGWTLVKKVSHVSLQAGIFQNDIECYNLPPGTLVEGVLIRHLESFDGTGITSYTLSVGIAGDLARYLPPFDARQAPGNSVYAANGNLDLQSFGTATSIRLAAVSDGAALDQSTSGFVEVWIKLSRLP